MARLGKRFFELGRGYKRISEQYSCPYVVGVDIHDQEKPFVVAMGDNHSDSAAKLLTMDEFLSDQWREQIQITDCLALVSQLTEALQKNETFPQQCILDFIRRKNEDM